MPSSQRSRRGRNTLKTRRSKERLGSAQCPEWLGDAAREFWNSYAPYLRKRGCLTRLDEAAFITLCVTWQRLAEMRELMATEGEILVSPRGRKYQHPAVAIHTKALQHFVELCKSFGLSPLQRHRIPAMESKTEQADDLDRLLASRKLQ
jgi:P27 family predicted phage terminase small subunit